MTKNTLNIIRNHQGRLQPPPPPQQPPRQQQQQHQHHHQQHDEFHQVSHFIFFDDFHKKELPLTYASLT